MKNPVYYEYRRSSLFGLILLLLLSCLGAVVHYLRSVDDKVVQTKVQLAAVSNQLDSEFAPVLAFMEATRRAALLKFSLPAELTDSVLPVLQLDSATQQQLPIMNADDASVSAELQMLQRLQPYFELAKDTQPHLVGMYYFSEQGFAYNGQSKWSDYVADQLLKWHNTTKQEPVYERGQIFFTDFLPQQAAVSLPLFFEDRKLGRFVFALALEPMLARMYQQYTHTDFMLLDQSGTVISSATAQPLQSINEHMLQIQRLRTMPWSLASLEQKTSLFAAGIKEFIWHWLSYALLLAVFLLLMQFRFRQRTLSPANRLLIHIERLYNGQAQGVRRVPEGWAEVFDRVSQLTQSKSDLK
jgi:hypothetical protein